MNKRALVKKFEEQIAADLSVLTKAAHSAHEAAIHSESKAEDEYDTRGLEASYLAGAQSKRAMELEECLAMYRHIDLQPFNEQTPIASTALVELESEGKQIYYLLMPKGGGMTTEFEGKTIHVVTPQSPLGQALLGTSVGDQISLEVQRVVREYDILKVW